MLQRTRALGADGSIVHSCCEAETAWYHWHRGNVLFTAWQSCWERCTFAVERAATEYATAIDERARRS